MAGRGGAAPRIGFFPVLATENRSQPWRQSYDLYGALQQKKGRALFNADFSAGGSECTPPETAWRATAASPNGLFTGGKATFSNAAIYACNDGSCDVADIPGPVPVKLSGKNKP